MSLSPCSVPGHKPSFTLGEDEMELGLGIENYCERYVVRGHCIHSGIHGEAGAERTKVSHYPFVHILILTQTVPLFSSCNQQMKWLKEC